jgi:molybdenum cofactor guanylyltransferase
MSESISIATVEFSAVILAGGRSSRMGRDKAWLNVDGRPLLERQLALARDLGPVEVFISGRPDTDYAPWHCPVLHDRVAGAGPLAGIAVALEASRTPHLLVLAVDLPRMTREVLDRLLVACAPDRGAVPRFPAGPEPLAALYPKSAAGLAFDQLKSGRLAARAFAESCDRAGLIRFVDLPIEQAACFANWNSPKDLDLGATEGNLASSQGAATPFKAPCRQ